MVVLKNLLFISILIYAGIYDYKKRIIPDKVHVIIMISALLSQFSIIQSILGLLILPIPFIIPIFSNEDSIGGGDIKLVGAIGFFLGLTKGTLAMIIGLSLSTIVSLLFKKHRNQLVPLAPYLATGSIIAFLI
ncbi:MAG TPA: prepilin peptidase [Bacteroidales bacterium]|nr:prepilin peptidase [Bacteroidales bacterium]